MTCQTDTGALATMRFTAKDEALAEQIRSIAPCEATHICRDPEYPNWGHVIIQESTQAPGYFDLVARTLDGECFTKKPVRAWGIQGMLKNMCGLDVYLLDFAPCGRQQIEDTSWKPRPRRYSEVYFIQAKTGGPIKIGYTHNVIARLDGLQVGNPEELRIVATVPGGAKEEAAIHRRLRRYRIRGEWFRDDDVVMAIIDDLRMKAAPR
jgi:hypothetical protein